ncbi:hypothetical protein BV898_11638 [Hypsibius exemplaris]|uniref:Uncharacterized protein n=1 Tax=Hypsibius exemplaris TaxID=2072580 RepID=A0A1W0WG43_HYPEX|nr:hypothetical protein BV898_11638 [Hypsibius exemplaris]
MQRLLSIMRRLLSIMRRLLFIMRRLLSASVVVGQGAVACLLLLSNQEVEANSDLGHDSRNSLPTEYKFAPQNVSHHNSTSTQLLKDLLSLVGKNGTSSAFSALQRVGLNSGQQMNSALLKSSLAMLLRLGNGTLNATVIADSLKRTGRNYGGGGGGGYGGGYGGGCCGFDPLWLLLGRDDHHERRENNNNNDNSNLAELALLSLLGLALIGRMPTQG